MNQQVYPTKLMDELRIHLLFGGLFFITIACSPVLIDNYTPAKWIIFYGVVTLALVFELIMKNSIFLPRSTLLLTFLILLAFSYLVSILANYYGTYQSYILSWLSFLFLSLVFYTIFSGSKGIIKIFYLYFMISTIFVVAYGYLQYFNYEFLPLARSEFPVSFFGHQNYTAEFVGSSIIVQVFSLYRPQRKIWRILIFLLISFSVSYLFILSCRGAMVACLLALVPVFIFYKSLKKKNFIFLLLGGVLVFLVSYKLPVNKRSFTLLDIPLSASKKLSANVRLATWGNSLGMVKDYPLGVGPGNFEFNYTKYRKYLMRDTEESEFAVKDSPHNGYIEAFVENGWLFGSVLVVFCLMCLLKLFKTKPEDEETEYIKWLSLALLIFFLCDALFAFPMGNPFPFYTMAIIIGMACSVIYRDAVSLPHKRVIAGICLMAILPFSLKYSIAKIIEFRPEYESIALSCKLFPENWNVCLEQAQIDYESDYFLDSQRILFKILDRQPNNFPAIWLMGLNFYAQENMHKACEYFLRYNEILDGDVADKELINDCRKRSM